MGEWFDEKERIVPNEKMKKEGYENIVVGVWSMSDFLFLSYYI